MSSHPAAPELTAVAFAARFTVIVAGLVALIARAFLRQPSLAPLIIPLCGRLTRTARRLTVIMAGIAAGQFPSPRFRPGRAGGRTARVVIPKTQAWLIRTLHHEAAGFASQLSHLLAAPGVSELLDAAPAARRLLRPICRMLDTPLPGLARSDTALRAVARQATSDTALRAVARQATGAPFRPESVIAPSLRPPPCPRLRLRWPWLPHPRAKPA